MKVRVISGAVLAVILVAVLLLGGPVLGLALLFCSIVGMYEMYKALGVLEEGSYVTPLAGVGYGAAVFYYIVLLANQQLFGVAAAVGVIAIVACYVINFPKYKSAEVVSTCFGFIYIGFMLSFVYLTRNDTQGIVRVWIVFASSWVADTAAYFTGMKFGKRKMTPILSPKKTWEGAVGGVIGAGIAGIILAAIFERNAILPYFLICMTGSVISICGDLAASAIKRETGIKDYGTLIPGHGGIMDRFDSVIFTAPFVYFMTQLFLTR
jgi:phosphatidate cytidylyltransferase